MIICSDHQSLICTDRRSAFSLSTIFFFFYWRGELLRETFVGLHLLFAYLVFLSAVYGVGGKCCGKIDVLYEQFSDYKQFYVLSAPFCNFSPKCRGFEVGGPIS